MATADPSLASSSTREPLVVFAQPQVAHYRLPVWDGIAERGEGAYRLEVIGPLDGGQAFGGGTRGYLRPMRHVQHFSGKFEMDRWPELKRIIRDERPAVVIVAANQRNLTHWTLRRTARKVDARLIAHAKAHSFAGLPPALTDLVKRSFFKRFDHIVGYGLSSRDELVALGVPADRVSVARNTIDTARIFSDGDAIRDRGAHLRHVAGLDGHRVIVCVGRLDPDKRQRDLLRAFVTAHAASPDLRLVFVGGGPDLEGIRAEADQLSPGHVLLTGRVPEGDDYAWIAAADVCVFPGAVGLAVNQALALGVPTIIADEPGADGEIVEHEVTGYRFGRGDTDAMAALIGRVLDPERRDEVSAVTERAAALMRDEVTIEAMVGVFDTAIRRMLSPTQHR